MLNELLLDNFVRQVNLLAVDLLVYGVRRVKRIKGSKETGNKRQYLLGSHIFLQQRSHHVEHHFLVPAKSLFDRNFLM